jgi:hypothetical protein
VVRKSDESIEHILPSNQTEQHPFNISWSSPSLRTSEVGIGFALAHF